MDKRLKTLFVVALLASSALPASALAQEYDRNDPIGFDNELRGYQTGSQPGTSPYDAPGYLSEFGRPQTRSDYERPGAGPNEYYGVPRVVPSQLPRNIPSNASDFFSSLTPQQQLRIANWSFGSDTSMTMGQMAVMMDFVDEEFDRQHLTPAQRVAVLRQLAGEAGIR
ncbi:MAG: hypothetical protein ABL973_13535 [Micropepsaceae bacterium]